MNQSCLTVAAFAPKLPSVSSHRPPGRSSLTYLQERTQTGMTDTFPRDQHGLQDCATAAPRTKGQLALKRPPRQGRAIRGTRTPLLMP